MTSKMLLSLGLIAAVSTAQATNHECVAYAFTCVDEVLMMTHHNDSSCAAGTPGESHPLMPSFPACQPMADRTGDQYLKFVCDGGVAKNKVYSTSDCMGTPIEETLLSCYTNSTNSGCGESTTPTTITPSAAPTTAAPTGPVTITPTTVAQSTATAWWPPWALAADFFCLSSCDRALVEPFFDVGTAAPGAEITTIAMAAGSKSICPITDDILADSCSASCATNPNFMEYERFLATCPTNEPTTAPTASPTTITPTTAAPTQFYTTWWPAWARTAPSDLSCLAACDQTLLTPLFALDGVAQLMGAVLDKSLCPAMLAISADNCSLPCAANLMFETVQDMMADCPLPTTAPTPAAATSNVTAPTAAASGRATAALGVVLAAAVAVLAF